MAGTDHIKKELSLNIDIGNKTEIRRALKEAEASAKGIEDRTKRALTLLLQQYEVEKKLNNIEKERQRIIESITSSYKKQAEEMRREWENQKDIARMSARGDIFGIFKSIKNEKYRREAATKSASAVEDYRKRIQAVEDNDTYTMTKGRKRGQKGSIKKLKERILKLQTRDESDRQEIASHEENIRKIKANEELSDNEKERRIAEENAKAEKANKRIWGRSLHLKGDLDEMGKIEQSKSAAKAQLEGERDVALEQIGIDADKKAFKAEMAADYVQEGIKAVKTTFRMINATANKLLGVSLSIKDNFMDILSEAGSILNMRTGAATYSTSTSLITNASARQQQMKYGLSSAQNWALSQTMGILGMQSDEDLMYMNQNQQQLFSNFMTKYSRWYDQLESSGVLQSVQQFQVDFAMFKQELAMDFMKWFADNKDLIFSTIKAIANVTTGIMQGLMQILSFLHIGGTWSNYGSSLSGSMSDYINGRAINNSKSVVVQVTQTNTATGVLSSQESLETFLKDAMQRNAQEIATAIQGS